MSEIPSVKQTELPQTIKNAYKKAEEGKKVERTDTVGISESTAMLSGIVRELRDAGVSSKDITKALQHSNRKTNESIGKEIKQAFNDYNGKKISSDDFKNRLYGTAIKKVDGITSTLHDLHGQRVGSVANNNGSTQAPRESIFANKTDSKASPTPSGNANKVLSEIVGMFNKMDKMINGLDKKLDDEGENKGFGDFVHGLKNMFSEIDSTVSRSFFKNPKKVADERSASDAHKLGIEIIKYKIPGMTTINGMKETIEDKDAQETEFSTLA